MAVLVGHLTIKFNSEGLLVVGGVKKGLSFWLVEGVQNFLRPVKGVKK